MILNTGSSGNLLTILTKKNRNLQKIYGKLTKIEFKFFEVFYVPEYVILIYFIFKFRKFFVIVFFSYDLYEQYRNFGYILIIFTKAPSRLLLKLERRTRI
jgi:hypothetical protein